MFFVNKIKLDLREYQRNFYDRSIFCSVTLLSDRFFICIQRFTECRSLGRYDRRSCKGRNNRTRSNSVRKVGERHAEADGAFLAALFAPFLARTNLRTREMLEARQKPQVGVNAYKSA